MLTSQTTTLRNEIRLTLNAYREQARVDAGWAPKMTTEADAKTVRRRALAALLAAYTTTAARTRMGG